MKNRMGLTWVLVLMVLLVSAMDSMACFRLFGRRSGGCCNSSATPQAQQTQVQAVEATTTASSSVTSCADGTCRNVYPPVFNGPVANTFRGIPYSSPSTCAGPGCTSRGLFGGIFRR